MKITYENLQNLRDLIFADTYYLDDNDTPLTSFFKGCIVSDKDLAMYISQYLWQYFGIDPFKNTLIQQVDHYAFEHGLDWDRGFINLMVNIIENPDVSREKDIFQNTIEKVPVLEYKPLYMYEGDEEPVAENIEASCESIQLKNGTGIRVGDSIKLCDKIGEDYKKTKFYDKSLRNPSWDLFYPSEKDFEYVFFYYEGDKNTKAFNFGRVRRLFSDSTSIIKYISIQNEVTFVYTDLFKVEIEKALEIQEVEILDKTKCLMATTDFSGFIAEVRKYYFSMPRLLKAIDEWCFSYFSSFKKEWEKNGVSISTHWFEKK